MFWNQLTSQHDRLLGNMTHFNNNDLYFQINKMGRKKVKTRNKSGDSWVPLDLPDTGALFVNKDIISAVENELGKEPKLKVSCAIEKVRKSVIEKFLQVNPALPLLSSKAVSTKISRLYSKSIKFKSNKVTAKVSSLFKDSLYKLFDIISCQCEIINCGGDKACRDVENCTGFHVFCTCPTEKKIPEKEVMIIKDQREKVGLHGGDMIMEGVDN